ncbi:membrane protein insertion efficiency factor YidD [Fortiea sp. LEGE XX443]|uniref:membrane protein insertion efficiency factor YidD n=1 Tax=Fortiea sp. LEGE XX443 TaxID=1828611 RepID=UPI00187F49FB|nr:membrane protein insertion efficiency factor YidD [Fortiea sp. LEGE XX443]MBE9004575.1 membrane protein insertion efficiency factor YidD [Fortiea sp. LEGE XX443]
MTTLSFEPLAKTMAINFITAYQKYISPFKGFSCPHRQLHGGESCSTYIKRMFYEQSLIEVVKSSQQRFQDCVFASKTLTKNSSGCIVIPCCLPF